MDGLNYHIGLVRAQVGVKGRTCRGVGGGHNKK